ncbi:MAG: hypothetical protein KDA84_09370 [Planctomycetaceae bacterium]|nr:hypothetical protein [Planctomycetaceae bacterium]
MGIEGFMIFAVVLLALGVVAWGGFTKHRSLGIAMTALIVAFVAAGCGFYAFVESQSLPWTIGYAVTAGLTLAVGLKHLIGKWKKHRAL